MKLFSLRDIRYRDILFIHDLSIYSHSVTTIWGESGSGKTTLLKLLNRMITPDEGVIDYIDRPLSSFDPVSLRREVVMLSQTPLLFDGSVRDNLIIGCLFAGKPIPDDVELRKILELFHLNKKLDEKPRNFSGGEKQRLSLARVLLMHPKVLLLDEPTSSLDSRLEENVMSQVFQLARDYETTLIFVTHSRELAYKHSHAIIYIENGQIKCQN